MKKNLILIGLMAVLALGTVETARCEQKPAAKSVAGKTSAREIYVTRVLFAVQNTKAEHARFSPDGKTIIFCDKRNEDKDLDVYVRGLTEWDFPYKIYDSGTDDEDARYIDSNSICIEEKKGYVVVGLKTVDVRDRFTGFIEQKLQTEEKKPLITGQPAHNICFSPDGSLLAYLRNSKSNLNEVFVRDLKTGKEKQLTFSDKDLKEWNKKHKDYGFKNDVNYDINEGPLAIGKGNSVYFQRQIVDMRSWYFAWWSVKQDGSLPEHGGWGRNFSFSPDYKWVCFCDDNHKENANVYITSSKRIEKEVYTNEEIEKSIVVEFKGKYFNPTWSPDGTKMVLFENDYVHDTVNMLLVTLGGPAIDSMSKR